MSQLLYLPSYLLLTCITLPSPFSFLSLLDGLKSTQKEVYKEDSEGEMMIQVSLCLEYPMIWISYMTDRWSLKRLLLYIWDFLNLRLDWKTSLMKSLHHLTKESMLEQIWGSKIHHGVKYYVEKVVENYRWHIIIRLLQDCGFCRIASWLIPGLRFNVFHCL